MKFQLYSDVHMEMHESFPTISKHADILILAGDMGNISNSNFEKFIKYVSETWEHVIYVPGNHEYYHDELCINELNSIYKCLMDKYSNIHYLQNDSWDFEEYTFIGSCLWSNPDKESIEYLNDFYQIKEHTKYGAATLTLETFKNMHNECIKFIKDQVSSSDKKIIVITHFPPIRTNTSHPRYEDDELKAYFTNDLDEMNINIDKIPLWISGHTHYSYDFMKNKCRFLSNQMGYTSEIKESKFNQQGLFEI